MNAIALFDLPLRAGSPARRSRLRQERDNLLDTIWLATSSQQIKDLWKKVVVLLGDEQTHLEKEALAIGVEGTSV